MTKIIKNTLLNYISNNFKTEDIINPKRIFEINKCPIKSGNVVYLCEREIRVKDNFALLFAIQKSKNLNLPLKIIHPAKIYSHKPKQEFINSQILQVKNQFRNLGLDFQIVYENPSDIFWEIDIATMIIDFNPIIKRNYLDMFDFKIYEIDGHNIVPARFVSEKQEYNASMLRRKIYYNIHPFLSEFKNITDEKIEADFVLDDFIKNKLSNYAEYKNNPSKNVLSGLSKYLNSGFISAHRVALEIIKSNVLLENKEIFLEELIIRKELSDNFCLYAKNFKNFSSVPDWAKKSLINHKLDMRQYIYTLKDLEKAKTHDVLWNAAQIQLMKEGTIHGYLRMYWAKKIAEWSLSPEVALKNSIYLNDKYAYDSPSPNGYVGILWAIGGLHDRAFKDFCVTGKIRRMTFDSVKRKCDLSGYLKKYENSGLTKINTMN